MIQTLHEFRSAQQIPRNRNAAEAVGASEQLFSRWARLGYLIDTESGTVYGPVTRRTGKKPDLF